MNTSLVLAVISSLFSGQDFLQWLADIGVKSSAIMILAWGVARVFQHKLSSASSHVLWLNALLCVALLPIAGELMSYVSAHTWTGVATAQISVFDVAAVHSQSANLETLDWFLIGYVAVCIALLARMLYAAKTLYSINAGARVVDESALLRRVDNWCQVLSISRKVTLKVSPEISSPISFGLLRPVVMFPLDTARWDASTAESVLIHELSHVKRLDWITMLFCQLMTCLLWFNPLLWLARARLIETAEEACDSAIVRCGNDGVRYAEELLRLARCGVGRTQPVLLAQNMFAQGMLSKRIRHILDNRSGARNSSNSKLAGILSLAVMLLILGGCSNFGLFGTNAEDIDYLPLIAESPQYPTLAAEGGIEGWCLVEFTVNKQGAVVADSIHVVDAEPAEIFDHTSRRAAAKFTFRPRVRGGQAVAVPGVQYLFRFELNENSTLENVRRPAPKARNRRSPPA